MNNITLKQEGLLDKLQYFQTKKNMKNFNLIFALAICSVFLFSTTSCLIVHDTGKPKNGWTKNSNNPHHPNSTNPGKGHEKKK